MMLQLALAYILFTLGMGLVGLAFLSFLRDSLRLAELTDRP